MSSMIILKALGAAALCAGLGACTLPLESRVGHAGALTASNRTLRIAAAPDGERPAERVVAAVTTELERRGFILSSDAPNSIEVAFAVRPSLLGLEAENGHARSAARNRKGLRPCRGYVHRLTLSVHADAAAPSPSEPVTGWAEQYRCSSRGEDSLTTLARLSVDALTDRAAGL